MFRGRSSRVLPGQYYDAETGNHYNYFRDYDPRIGRYIESDPIGLAGGINTFGYAFQSPLQFGDLYGLECFWLDQGNVEKCTPTGAKRKKPTQHYSTRVFFPVPDPSSPTLTVGPTPPMPGMQLIYQVIFHEKGYWEMEVSCEVFATMICKEPCGKETWLPGNMQKGKKWIAEPDSNYHEKTDGPIGYTGAPSGPYDLEGVGRGPRRR